MPNIFLTIRVYLVRKNRKFVSTQTGHDVGIPEGMLQDLRRLFDCEVALGVAKAIVDLFQAVNVRKKEKCILVVPAREFELLASEREKASTVVEPCQIIRQCKVSEFFLDHVLLNGAMRHPSKEPAHQPEEPLRRVRRRRDLHDFVQNPREFVSVSGEDGGCESLADYFRNRMPIPRGSLNTE